VFDAALAIKGIIADLVSDLYGVEDFEVPLEPTRDLERGDLSTTAAMRLARAARKAPPAIASELAAALSEAAAADEGLAGAVERVETAGGFMNIRFARSFWAALLGRIAAEGERYGRLPSRGERAQVEFVSANPTGPLTVAHGRQAAIGDTLARILSFAGWDVEREYYLNDTGNQIRMLGLSVYLRLRELKGEAVELCENCYRGEYVMELARKADSLFGRELEEMDEAEAVARLGRFACDEILEWIKADLERMRVRFDGYFSQEEMERSGAVDELMREFRAKGLVYERDGAVWLKTSAFGDAEDRVLVKADGSYTYRTPDMAYHADKFRRGYARMLVLLGPDHHAHTITMKAGLKALGFDTSKLEYLLVQHCTLYEGDKQLRMSTRQGTFVTLAEVMDAVGVDAARFFFLNRGVESHLDFDLELAKRQSSDNPVFYLQYAAARCASIMRRGLEGGWISPDECRDGLRFAPPSDGELEEDEELLARRLGRFPLVVERAAAAADHMKVINYLMELVESFHNYYQRRRVLVEDRRTARTRLGLVSAFRTVLANGLGLLGVEAPERM